MLPFKPTGAQKRVIQEIAADMSQPRPMNRLLQGDVGSGKTIVAAEAAVIALENGYQVAVLAPTEILARSTASTSSRSAPSSAMWWRCSPDLHQRARRTS
jgi:RecG-like helicase